MSLKGRGVAAAPTIDEGFVRVRGERSLPVAIQRRSRWRASNRRTVGRGSRAYEMPLGRWGSGVARRLPGRNPTALTLARIQTAQGWSWVSGAGTLLTGDATGRTVAPAREGSMPKRRRLAGGC